jgi:hypothetical protein
MSNKNTGGPAFPYQLDQTGCFSYGMTLRDYFAGQALIGLGESINMFSNRSVAAEAAFSIADAMLSERDKS